MFLNAANCQGYSFYRFWVIKGGWCGHTQISVKAKALLKPSFSEAQDWRHSVKKTPTQVFSSEFLGSLKNTCLEECLRTIASGLLLKSINIEISQLSKANW